MDKSNPKTLFLVVGAVFSILCVEHYSEIKGILAEFSILKDLGENLPVIATLASGFGVLWYQRKREAEEKAKSTLLASTYRLGAQFSTTVNVFCLSIEKWVGTDCVTFSKFSLLNGRQQTDVSELAAIEGMTGLLTELILVEDSLGNMRVHMEGINELIDEANSAPPVKKVQLRNEIMLSVKDCIEIVLSNSKEFKAVAVKLNKELKKLKKGVEIDIERTDELIAKAEGVKRVFERMKLDPRPSSIRAFLERLDNKVVYKHLNGLQQEFGPTELLNGGLEYLVKITAEEYGEDVGEELRVALLEWLVGFWYTILVRNTQQKAKASAESEDEKKSAEAA
ncbi:hypothetical protein [Halodesulfovibrio marinisediminis]|uniref:Uncharacterized protein n=1 Tax=Halodesulfovibrio marinisediminis DSM 17456 TaxID=1121457 RepID=A0A1N6HYU8_9BACT|nr:hypothetical protein [Halodesulfovibrio marinisediminis]SIO24984.1 hypothetical protein SAMN02745161_2290 [Halodesulfovibrio marinisediminis DSM 17456]